MPMRALIVDDEPLAREKLRLYLGGNPDVELIGECGNGIEAIDRIRRERPDLLFLDAQMPEVDGFQVLENLATGELPFVIFTTAYDQYALRAFDVHAVDYLLKPIDQERFRDAVERARIALANRSAHETNRSVLNVLQEMRQQRRYPPRVAVRTPGKTFLVPTDDVAWIEADANYVQVHTRKQTYRMRDTMTGVEQRLDPEMFVRAHRSAIVNIDHIAQLQISPQGEHTAVLDDGARIGLSRGYRDRIRQLLREPMTA